MSDYISEDNLVQIFKWLPVKSLLRFRCVCKWWKRILDSQSFKQEHLALQEPRFISTYEEQEFLVFDPQTLPSLDTLSYPFEVDDAHRLVLINTLHGVVFLYNQSQNNLVLWNPAIRKSFTLSFPEIMQFDWWEGWDEIPETAPRIVAHSSFWIDPSDNSFKLVIFKLCSESVDGALYSSIDRGWRALPLDGARSCRPLNEGPHVTRMIDGVAYWRACSNHRIVIVSLDFLQERFGMIEVPRLQHMKYTGHDCPMHCILKGTLSLMYWDSEYPQRCDIYSRREGKWVNVFRLGPLAPYVYSVLWAVEGVGGWCDVLAEATRNPENGTHVFGLYDSIYGCIALKSGLKYNGEIHVDNHFVESLVFPNTQPT